MKHKLSVLLFAVYKMAELNIRLFFTRESDFAGLAQIDWEADCLEQLLDKTFKEN